MLQVQVQALSFSNWAGCGDMGWDEIIVENLGRQEEEEEEGQVFNFFLSLKELFSQVQVFENILTRVVSHCSLAICILKYFKAKKNYGNSNISPCKNIIFKKSSYKTRPITQGLKSIKLLYSIMNLNTISLPWQARPKIKIALSR